MNLRARLLLASGILLGVVLLGAIVLLQTQQSYLIDQIDDQLAAASPLVRVRPPIRSELPPEPPQAASDSPISNVYIGTIDDGGSLVTVLQGQLLDDAPALDLTDTELHQLANGAPITVGGQQTDARFRVAVIQPIASDPLSIVALPLDEVDNAVGRLRWTLGGVLIAVAIVLIVVVWWVQRLSLRPIARLTAAADAIAGGDHGHRVLVADPRTEAGKLATAFNVMLDERDATEERLRVFVADASHELRTPLTSIRGYLDLYREGGFQGRPELDDMVRRMSQESNRMNDLVEDLLLLANLDQHRPLRRERVDLGHLLTDAASDAAVLQPERPITVDIAAPLPIETVGDTHRLQQVISALITNTLAYTERPARLHLTASATPDGCEIIVADDGPGIAAHDAARVFDRFYRGDASRTRRTGGSGLGLAIAQSIVHAHRGTITLRTAPGQGCRFVITLPSHESPGRPAQSPRETDVAQHQGPCPLSPAGGRDVV
ncbi:MAG TPA: HAMP domain-containing sensor histidine kinase [Ilumatobacter sp.]